METNQQTETVTITKAEYKQVSELVRALFLRLCLETKYSKAWHRTSDDTIQIYILFPEGTTGLQLEDSEEIMEYIERMNAFEADNNLMDIDTTYDDIVKRFSGSTGIPTVEVPEEKFKEWIQEHEHKAGVAHKDGPCD